MTAAQHLPDGLYVPELSDDQDVLSAALAYAAAGWFVLPVRSGSKRPGSVVGGDWPAKSSRNPQVIAAWFAGTDHGIALHVGRSGAVVLDVDHPAELPDDLAAELAAAPFQSTRPDRPGRGHALFLQPPGRRLGNSLGELAPDWGDIRGANGVIIVAPSRHGDGGRYRWVRGGPLPVLPGWIAGKLPDAGQSDVGVVVDIRTGETSADPDPFRIWSLEEAELQRDLRLDALRRTPGGAINSELNSAAMFLGHFAHGDGFWTTNQAGQWLLEAQRAAWLAGGGSDDRDYREAMGTIKSGLRAGLRKPWTCVQPFAAPAATSTPDADEDGQDDVPVDAFALAVEQEARRELLKRAARRRADELEAGDVDAAARFDVRFLDGTELDRLPQPDPLIPSVLSRHTYAVLRGRDASFKSFVAMDWAMSLATGTPWLGRRVEQCRVLYLAAEGAYGLRLRRRAWEQTHGIVLPVGAMTVRVGAVPFFKGGAEFDHFLAWVARGEYGLVVLDTLRRISGGADGNGSDMGVVVDRVIQVKEATANGAALAIAHTGKVDEDTRGASSIEDDSDIVWHCKREDDGGSGLTIKCAKFKDGPDGHVFELKTRVVELDGLARDDGRPETSLVVERAVGLTKVTAPESMQRQRVYDVVKAAPATGVTMAYLVEVERLPKTTVHRSLNALAGQKLIEKRGQSWYPVQADSAAS